MIWGVFLCCWVSLHFLGLGGEGFWGCFVGFCVGVFGFCEFVLYRVVVACLCVWFLVLAWFVVLGGVVPVIFFRGVCG